MDRLAPRDPQVGMDPPAAIAPGPIVGLRDFEALYEAEFGFVWRSLGRFGVGAAHVEDAAQDVFVAVYRRADRFDDRSIRGLLYVFARRVAARYRRRAQRETGLADAEPVGDHADPYEHAKRAEAAGVLQAFLNGLPAGQRDAFILADLEQWNAPEIAGALELPLGTIYSRLRAARGRFDQLVQRLRAQENREGTDRASLIAAARRRENASGSASRVWAALLVRLPTVPQVLAPSLLGSATAKIVAVAITAVVGVGVITAVATAEPPPGPQSSDPRLASAAPRLPPAPIPAAAQAESTPAAVAPVVPPPPLTVTTAAEVQPPPPPTRKSKAGEATLPREHTPSADDRLARELELLGRVKRALADGRSLVALNLVREHERRFERGRLVDERLAAEVAALCALGRDAQAKASARRLRGAHPNTPAAARIDGSCVDSR